MKAKNKVFAAVAILMITALVATGCSSGTKTDVQQTVQTSTKQAVQTKSDESSNVNEIGFPIVKQPITMTVFGQRDPNQAPWKDILVLKEYEKMTNIKMDYQEIPQQSYDEKKNLLFASNELPDVFVRGWLKSNDIVSYGMNGKQLIPLESLIDKYAPNVKNIFQQYPEVKKALTAPDGHIYVIPTMATTLVSRIDSKQWVNKNWLDKLGLKPPTTPDEYINVLRAFRDKDPNGNGKQDEIPMGYRDMGMVYNCLAGSWGLQSQFGYQINIENDKAKIWLTDNRFKEYLQFLNKLYTEKLLWSDFYKKDLPKWRSNLSNGLYGLFYMPYSDVFLNRENDYIGFQPIKGPYGDQMWTSYGPPNLSQQGAFALSNVNKDPEAAMRWVDYFYGDEGSIFFAFGIEGKTYTKKSDGTPVINDSIKNDPRGFMTALGEINLVPGMGFPYLLSDKNASILATDKTKEVADVLGAYLPKTVYPAPIFDKSTLDKIIPIQTDLDKYKDETVAKFIMGELSFDHWDEYVNTLNKIGLSELEKAYQNAYDQMKK